MPHDERDDYADDPLRPFGRIDRLFAGIEPIHFMFLVLVPCWWLLVPATLGWAGIGLLACRHPIARQNAIILFVVGLVQLVPWAFFVYAMPRAGPF